MVSEVYDVAVVGAGIIGTCAAYHAQKSGLRTILIEQYSTGHSYGSSAGKSRIIRYAHTDAVYLPLVKESFDQIAELEKKRGEKLWTKTGLLWLGKLEEVQAISRIMTDFGAENEILSNVEVAKRYPQFQYGSQYKGLVDPIGGVIYADKWLAAFTDEFRKLGGTVLDSTSVKSFSDGARVTLKTTRGDLIAKKAIFALGTWINKLVPDFPVKCRNEAISVAYWVPKKKEDEHLTMPDKYPVVCVNTDKLGFYSLPSCDYKGAVKFAFHEGEQYEVDQEVVSFNQRFVDETREHLAKNVPFLETENGPWRIDRCKYAMSPDEHYIIDYLPGSRNIQVVGFMSGTGFKNGPSLGRALAQIIKGEKPYIDLSYFSIHRFKNKSKL